MAGASRQACALRLLRPGPSLWLPSYLRARQGHVGADVTWTLRIVEDGGDGGADEVVAVHVTASPVDYGAVVEVLDDVVPDLSRAIELDTDGAAAVWVRDRIVAGDQSIHAARGHQDAVRA